MRVEAAGALDPRFSLEAASPVASAQTVVSFVVTVVPRIHGGKRPANIRGRIDLPGNAAREVRVDQPCDFTSLPVAAPDPWILGREEAGRNAPLPTGQQHWPLSYKARAHHYKTRVVWM